jgi:hypothetical protein
MKSNLKVQLGRWLMNRQPINIMIVDDVDAYFNER